MSPLPQNREDLGGFTRVLVAGVPSERDTASLQVEPVSLQQLVVRTTQFHDAAFAGAGNGNGTGTGTGTGKGDRS